MATIFRLKTTESINDFPRRVLQHLQQFRDKLDDPRQDLERMDVSKDEVAGALTVRSDALSGQVTTNAAGHEIVTGQLVDLFWEGGSRAGVVVGTVDGQNLPFSGGSGANLPAQSTAVTVVHYKTLATIVGAVDEEGELNANVAYSVRSEIASMIATVENAITQATARIVELQQ